MVKQKVGAIIQARYDSNRIPGKVLMPLPRNSGISLLEHIVSRLRKVPNIEHVIIATSAEENDLPVVDEAKRIGADFYTGSKDDVLSRFSGAASQFNLDHVVRLTGDNPIVLIDVMEERIHKHVSGAYDYTRNDGLPYGTSFEIVSTKSLDQIYANGPSKEEREHVTLFIKRNRKLFRILEKKFEETELSKQLRLTIDYPSDYALMNILMDILSCNNFNYSLEELLQIFEKEPWLAEINNENIQKKQYMSFSAELPEAKEILKKYALKHTLDKLNDLESITK